MSASTNNSNVPPVGAPYSTGEDISDEQVNGREMQTGTKKVEALQSVSTNLHHL